MRNSLPYLDVLDITVWQRRDKALRVADTPVAEQFEKATGAISDSAMHQEPNQAITDSVTTTATVVDDSVNDTPLIHPTPIPAPTTPTQEHNVSDIEVPPDYLFVPPDAVFEDNFEPLLPDHDTAFVPEPELDPKQIRTQGILGLDWDALQTRVQQCKDCELYKKRNNTVFGVGDAQARWLIVGEAPGHDEDLQGEPFVGRAGQLLNAMLQAVGVKREQVFIANTVKCRPPNNRNPDALEMETCAPYLQRQIQLIQPQLILVIGRVAVQQILQKEEAIGRLRGKLHTYADTGIPVIVSYHPAYLLRRPAEKAKTWTDLQLACRHVKPLSG